MSNSKKFIKRSATLGALAREYDVECSTLVSMIKPYTEVHDEIQKHIIGIKNKGAKLLPPGLVNKIYDVLGEP